MTRTSEFPLIETARCHIRLATLEEAPMLAEFHAKNREHLLPWEPFQPESYYTAAYWQQRIAQDIETFLRGSAVRLVVLHKETGEIIGCINYFHVHPSGSKYCTLGYKVGKAWEGQGYMTETIDAANRYIFESLNLYRIQANYLPRNTRSAKLLRRLGFAVEGFIPEFLEINGVREDHILTSLRPNQRPPSCLRKLYDACVAYPLFTLWRLLK